jgi:calcineurin-like phosphoesterase family protein
MKKIYFIGDMHLGDETIIKLEKRPFEDSLDQTDVFVKNWNSLITDNDIVYVVGDFLDKNYSSYHLAKVQTLKGKKYLIRGNHDTFSDEFYRNECKFINVYDNPILLDNFWIISHDPQYINCYFPYANIFAHVHNNPIYKTHSSRHYCVSAERTNYYPISFDFIKETITKDSLIDNEGGVSR